MDIGSNGGVQKNKEWETTRATKTGRLELVLRVLALILTLAAAILLGLDKQTKIVPIKVFPNLPALNVPVMAKFSHVSAFVYSVVANSIASVFAAVSLALTLGSGKGGSRLMMILVLDLIMVSLLFSSIGGTSAVGVIGEGKSSVLHEASNSIHDLYGAGVEKVVMIMGFYPLGCALINVLNDFLAGRNPRRTRILSNPTSFTWDFYNPSEAVNTVLAESAWSGQPLVEICHTLASKHCHTWRMESPPLPLIPVYLEWRCNHFLLYG
uniref:CASP-like protein n=1 Tax=Chenopodium quinoa TaxID=63459 RepID=A0A803MB96_CHEQI